MGEIESVFGEGLTRVEEGAVIVFADMQKNPRRFPMFSAMRVSDLDWRFMILIIPPLFLVAFLTLSSTLINPFSTLSPIRSFILGRSFQIPRNDAADSQSQYTKEILVSSTSKEELDRSRIAICLVGGARRFELTGPSIMKYILEEHPNADLFLHSPMDQNAFKFSLLKQATRIASVKIFEPKPIPVTEFELRVLTASNSPNGVQGLLQYFNLVEGCFTQVKEFQELNKFTYDWIVRTRVDGYWNGPLLPENFVPGHYVVPSGSSYGGLNDRLGIGDFNTSNVALSRLSLVPKLDAAKFRQLNSETSFKAQLTTQGVSYLAKRVSFCVLSDRQYEFPPQQYGVPVASISSAGPLSGAKCRPCKPACEDECVGEVMTSLQKGWSWTEWENGSLKLCNAHGQWEKEWETIFDESAGERFASERKRVQNLKMKQCVDDFNEMNQKTALWDTPPVENLCKMGLLQ